MISLAQKDERVCAITAAMPGGTGLLEFQRRFPKRTFDVGIAEEHAVSMAAGLAKQGMVPVLALYSTFLQRGYDQILQDIAMLHLHVVLAIDRAGLVGDDGPTHHGVFDVGFLRQVPGMLILNPASLLEQQEMLSWAVEEYDGPVAVRYPRGGEGSESASYWQGLSGSQLVRHRQGTDVTLVTYGSLIENVLAAAEILESQGIGATVLRLLSVSTLPTEEILAAMAPGKPVIVAEEVLSGSGIGWELGWQLDKHLPGSRVEVRDLGPDYVPHGSQRELYQFCGLDGQSLAAFAKEVLAREG